MRNELRALILARRERDGFEQDAIAGIAARAHLEDLLAERDAEIERLQDALTSCDIYASPVRFDGTIGAEPARRIRKIIFDARLNYNRG